MRYAFADTVYWVALARPRDQWRDDAEAARDGVGECILVTTDEVLTEFLASMGRCGPELRQLAAGVVRRVFGDANTKVIPQSRRSFLRGVALYEQRLDKSYSLVDCISMETMRDEGLTEILTTDRHFEQEGFAVLMRHPEA
jgi:predicted nucleic acid-binding protein